jgi:hypothetical protein
MKNETNKYEETQDSLIIVNAKQVEEQFQGNVGAATDDMINFNWELEVQGFFA